MDASNALFGGFAVVVVAVMIEAFEAVFIAQSAAREAGVLLFDSTTAVVVVVVLLAFGGCGFDYAGFEGGTNVLAQAKG